MIGWQRQAQLGDGLPQLQGTTIAKAFGLDAATPMCPNIQFQNEEARWFYDPSVTATSLRGILS
jgi:hypothetical protein